MTDEVAFVAAYNDQHTVSICREGQETLIRIGCLIHSPEFWRKHLEDIGKENYYSEDEIAVYRYFIEAAAEVVKRHNFDDNKTYTVGDKFLHEESDERYVLAAVDSHDSQLYITLICIEDGQRWCKPAKFNNIDHYNGTNIKLSTIAPDSYDQFTPIEKF